MTEVKIVDIHTQKVIGLRQTGCYSKIGEMIPRVFSFAVSQQGVEIVGPPIFVCHEPIEMDAMKADKEGCADIEVCVPVSGDIPSQGDFKIYELPGGKMAQIVHHGPYEQCGPIYQNLFGWILDKGYTVTGPTREVYLNDPRVVSPEQIITEILAPID